MSAESPFAVPNPWRDIATAPRDGTKFWGEVDEDAIAMFWHPHFKAFVSSYRRMELADGMTFEDTGIGYKDHSAVVHVPTAWMPSPPSFATRLRAALKDERT